MSTDVAAQRVRVFGVTSAEGHGGIPLELAPKSTNLLALLVAAGPDGLTTEQLLNELADGDATKNSQSKLRVDLSRLRQRLGDAIPSGRGRWRLDLPTDCVDFFELVERAEGDLPVDPAHALRLLAGTPFQDSGHSPIVQSAITQVRAARQMLLEEVTRNRPRLLSATVLDAARKLVAEDPFNDAFTRSVVDAHRVAGARSAARQLLDEVEAAYGEANNYDATRFLTELRGQLDDEPLRHNSFVGVTDPGATALVGRSDEYVALVDWLDSPTPCAVLTGVNGSGKTRLAGELVEHSAERGLHPLVITGHATARAAFSAWREAMPSMTDSFARYHDASLLDVLVAKSQLWESVRGDVLKLHSPRLIVIDDVQALDSLSLELCEFLVRTAAEDLRILIVGRPSDEHGDWSALHALALASSAVTIELEGLSVAALELLIAERQPQSRIVARAQYAHELVEVCQGLPAIANVLIDLAGPELLPSTEIPTGHGLDVVLDELTDDEFAVAHAVATFGQGTTWDNVEKLVDMSEPELLTSVEGLRRRGVLMTDHGAETTVRLSHVLMRTAIIARAPETERWRANRDAALLATSIHERAEHEFLALPLVDGATSAASLLLSASAHVADGAYREAISAFQRAKLRQGGEPLPVTSLIDWAGALDRLGLDGAEVRAEAVRRSLAASDADQALDAATSGLPEAESSVGDPARVEHLLAIPVADLSDESRFAHAVTTGRQLSLVGRTLDAKVWLDRAYDYAQVAAEYAEQARARWLAECATTSPLARLEDPLVYPPEATTVEVAHLRATDLMASWRFEECEDACKRVAEQLEVEPSPFVEWRHTLFAGTRALALGDLESAAQGTNDAFAIGSRYGLRDAGPAWLAQVFMSTWMQRGAAELASPMRLAQADVGGSILAESAFALALADNGEWDAALDLARVTIRRSLTGDTYLRTAALVLAARVIGADDPSELSREVYDVLEPRKDSLAVLGAGFGCMGPVDLALGFLSTGHTRKTHFARGLHMLDASPLLGWRVGARLEMSRSFGDAQLLAEARDLAADLDWTWS